MDSRHQPGLAGSSLSRLLGSLLMMAALICGSASSLAARPPKARALAFKGLFGEVKRGKPFSKNLDMYIRHDGESFTTALATARSFNTAIHNMLQHSLVVGADGSVAGSVTIRMNPDPHIPRTEAF